MKYKFITSDSIKTDDFFSQNIDQNIYNASISNIKVDSSWNRIIKSNIFIRYQKIVNPQEIMQTDFNFYLEHLFSEYQKNNNSKTQYFSSLFSRSKDETFLETICEAAEFITSFDNRMPPNFLSEKMIMLLIDISFTNKGKSSCFVLKTLKNITEFSYDAASFLLKNGFLGNFISLFNNAQSNEIKLFTAFLISSLAKYDNGDESAQIIFDFFMDLPLRFPSFFEISLRAFSLLVEHHKNLFINTTLVKMFCNYINLDNDSLNYSCFSILSRLCEINSSIIDFMYNQHIFKKVYAILSVKPSILCFDFLINVVKSTRNYDLIIYNDEFLALFEHLYENNRFIIKSKISYLYGLALLNCHQSILTKILNSNIFIDLIDLISASNSYELMELLIRGINRAFSMVDPSFFSEEYFCEFLQNLSTILNSINTTCELHSYVCSILEMNANLI